MTRKTATKTGTDTRTAAEKRLGRKITLSRMALLWERAWPPLAGILALLGVFAVLGLADLWRMLPVGVHVFGLGIFALGLAWGLLALARIKWPTSDEGRARLDRSPGVRHRPATGVADKLSGAPGRHATQLWATHRQRLRRQLQSIPVRPPAPRLPARDPFALRAIVVLALVVAVVYAGADWRDRLSFAFTPSVAVAGSTGRLDAWITPPAYTQKAPVYLADGGKTLNELNIGEAPVVITVPVNSALVLRFSGAGAGAASFGAPGEAGAALTPDDDGKITQSIIADARLVVTRRAGTPLVWEFRVTPDATPTIAFTQDLQAPDGKTLRFAYAAQDDYGVVDAGAELRLANQAAVPETGTGPALEISPPDFALLLPGLRSRKAEQTMYRDLTEHPWAGLEVDVQLVARDEAGQEGRSKKTRITLPMRSFSEPLARAVIEQRRALVLRPQEHENVALALRALTLNPERFIEDVVVYLTLSAAFRRTGQIQTSAQLTEVVDLLWDVALRIEDGDLSLAERELRAAKEALMRALARKAPAEEIKRLMREMKEAMARYLRSLEEQIARSDQNSDPQSDNNQTIGAEDLAKMMRAIEQLAKNGANEAAMQLLSQLSAILENIEGRRQTGQMSAEQSMLSDMLNQLGEMIGRQQSLMDDTFRGENGQQPPPNSGGQRPGADGEMTLAERQQALRQALEDILGQMREGGLNSPGALDRAGEAMGRAEQRLREGENGQAVGRQGEAVDQMRQGARSMARQLADGMATRPGQNRRGSTGQNGRTDPLGRPLPNNGPDFGLSVQVPDEMDPAASRRIRDELRRRLSEQQRRRIERDYIERLLNRF